MFTVYTFGDSILDCGRYNGYGVTPGALLARNDDALFPEHAGSDLASLGDVRLVHRAVDGARVDDLGAQAAGVAWGGPGVAVVTCGGNDLLAHFHGARFGTPLPALARKFDEFLGSLPVPALVANVYDPTCGDDALNFLQVPASVARAALARVNAAIAEVVARHRDATLVDLHAHFLRGPLTWFAHTIEPSLEGASEVRAAFYPAARAAMEASLLAAVAW